MRPEQAVIDKVKIPIPKPWWKLVEEISVGESLVVNTLNDVTAIRIGLYKKKSTAKVSAEKFGKKYRVWRVR